MSGVTNELIKKAGKISKNFPNSERDVLLSTGEQMASALIAGKLCDLGFNSRSWMSWQVPIYTEGKHKFSRINKINKSQILNYLKKINKKSKRIYFFGGSTTFGYGVTDEQTIPLASLRS